VDFPSGRIGIRKSPQVIGVGFFIINALGVNYTRVIP